MNNRSVTECLLEGNGLTANEASRLGPAVEEVMRSKTSRERCVVLMKLVREEFPHSIMYGVNISGGIITSCENMQQSLLFGPSPSMRDGVEPAFDANWQALEALCQRMGTGQLAELQFTDGRPIRAKTTPRGRRFRYFIKD